MKKEESVALSLVSFLLFLFIILYSLDHLKTKTDSENIRVIEANIRKAAVTCYAIEGAYPSSIDYLEENYGLQVNRDKYVVEYDIIGSNVMPWVAVAEKGTYYFETSWS